MCMCVGGAAVVGHPPCRAACVDPCPTTVHVPTLAQTLCMCRPLPKHCEGGWGCGWRAEWSASR
eukprot:38608-Chlamydomonas_euryale.AAC.2